MTHSSLRGQDNTNVEKCWAPKTKYTQIKDINNIKNAIRK